MSRPSSAESASINTRMQKTVFIFLRVGILVRNFSSPQFIEEMTRSGYRFVIFTSVPDHPSLRRIFPHDCFHFEKMDTKLGRSTLFRNRLSSFLVLVRRYTYGNTYFGENGRLISQMDELRNEKMPQFGMIGRLYHELIILGARLASRSKAVRAFLSWLEGKITWYDAHAKAYEQYKPSLMIVTSLGYDQDSLVMREASDYGAETLVLLKNWDVTTTRGIGSIVPNHVLVWNELMKQEVVRYHDVPAERVKISGVLQWDHYFRNDSPLLPKKDFLDRYDLSGERKIIYFAMTTPDLYFHNIQLLRLLVQWIRDGRIQGHPQLLVRLHPGYVLNNYFSDEVRNELEAIKKGFGDIVRFSFPKSESHDGLVIPTEENDVDLKEILSYSDVMVTVYSTQLVEGTIFDLPVVNAGLWNFKSSSLPVSTYEDWDHIIQILDREAISYCYTEDEIIEAINLDLANRDRLSAGRRRIAEKLVPSALRCQAAQQTFEHIRAVLDGQDRS